MAQSEMSGYNFTLKWQGENVKIGAGDSSVDIDTKAVAKVLASVGSVIAAQDTSLLVKFSAVSLGTFVAVAGAIKTWNWLQATDLPANNILQLSAPKSKKADFDELISNGKLEKTMKEALRNPKQAIQSAVDTNVSEKDVDELVKRLGDIRLSSVERCPGKDGGDVIGKIVKGKRTVNAKDRVEIIAPISGSGNVVGEIIEAGAEANYTYSGGVQMIGGVSQDIQRHAIDTVAGDKISVSLKYSDYSPKFEGKYKPSQTVYDIIVDVVACIKKRTDVKYKHIKDPTGAKIENDNITILQLQEKGWLKTMTIIVES